MIQCPRENPDRHQNLIIPPWATPQLQGHSQEFAKGGGDKLGSGAEPRSGSEGKAPRSRRHMLNIRLNKIHKNSCTHAPPLGYATPQLSAKFRQYPFITLEQL